MQGEIGLNMKIKSLTLRNYKQFTEEKTFWFTDTGDATGEVNDITLLVGNNGTGKSTILQAIAAVVGGAVLDKFRPSSLQWSGFHYPYLQNGRTALRAETALTFTQDEVDATRSFCQELNEFYTGTERAYNIPPNQTHVTLTLDYPDARVLATHESGKDAFFLTHGYQYAKQLQAKQDATNGQRFERVGAIYWFPENRTLSSISDDIFEEAEISKSLSEITRMKNLIFRWYSTHINKAKRPLRPGQYDKFEILKESYEAIFQGRSLVYAGLAAGGGNGLDVIFSDGRYEYDMSEMSAGERAIFPLLVEFADKKINNSIILIDEIELHLHPPLQYALLKALPKLGKNNQFIIATHSDYVVSWMAEDSIHNIIRLDA